MAVFLKPVVVWLTLLLLLPYQSHASPDGPIDHPSAWENIIESGTVDFNRDGNLDIVVATETGVYVRITDPTHPQKGEYVRILKLDNVAGIAVYDRDGDGHREVWVQITGSDTRTREVKIWEVDESQPDECKVTLHATSPTWSNPDFYRNGQAAFSWMSETQEAIDNCTFEVRVWFMWDHDKDGSYVTPKIPVMAYSSGKLSVQNGRLLCGPPFACKHIPEEAVLNIAFTGWGYWHVCPHNTGFCTEPQRLHIHY